MMVWIFFLNTMTVWGIYVKFQLGYIGSCQNTGNNGLSVCKVPLQKIMTEFSHCGPRLGAAPKKKGYTYTLENSHVEPPKWRFGSDELPFQKDDFQVPAVSFRGVGYFFSLQIQVF